MNETTIAVLLLGVVLILCVNQISNQLHAIHRTLLDVQHNTQRIPATDGFF